MFKHDDIQIYPFSEVPLNQDIYLMGTEWLAPYEKSIVSFLKGSSDFDTVGFISYASARTINEHSIELSWYPNVHDRFHEVRVLLPRTAFVMCVASWTIDEKPRIFVTTEWLNQLHTRSYSLFAMVDAIGVKAALLNGSFTHDRLVELQSKIDEIAARNPDIAFVSFADSVFLKMNWTVGIWDSEIKYSYNPEKILRPLIEINDAYMSALSMFQCIIQKFSKNTVKG